MNLKRIVDAAPFFGPFLANNQMVCKYLSSEINKVKLNLKIQITNSVVIIGTTRDPATPYAWSVKLSKSFHNSLLVTLDADGHTGQGRDIPCIEGIVNSYLLNFSGLVGAKTCGAVGK